MENTPKQFYSQFGEDKIVYDNRLTFRLPPKEGVFIDVGAGHPTKFSNSYIWECMGWDVYCIDPDPQQVKLLKKERQKVFKVGISDHDHQGEFYITTPDLSRSTPDRLINNREHKKEIIEFITLDTFCTQNNIKKIDIVSIDVEGDEMAVLEGFDIHKYNPKILIVEYTTAGKDYTIEEELKEYMIYKKYKCVRTTEANLIFKKI